VLSVVRITPNRERLAHAGGSVEVAQIALGGVPRGAALVLCSPRQRDGEDAHVLNELAAHGYEGIAATVHGTEGLDAHVSVVEMLMERLAQRGWHPGQVGAVGYESPIRLAARVGADVGFGALVTVSPTGLVEDGTDILAHDLPALVSEVVTPWLIMVGSSDPSAPAAALTSLAGVLDERAAKYTQVVRFPSVAADYYQRSTESLELAASFDYWQRTIEWLNAQVEPRPTPLAQAWRDRQAAPAIAAQQVTHSRSHVRQEGA
jgi:carboxymethylenebutenolidase